MPKHHSSILWVCLLALSWAAPAYALRPHSRADKSWMLGVSWGIGQAHYTSGDGVDTTLKRGAAPQIRFGRILSSHFVAALEYEGWLFEEGDVTAKTRRSFQAATLALSWFPGGQSPGWGGLYLRSGAGIGWGSIANIGLVRDENGDLVQEHGHRTDEPGLGLVFGLGYEFRLIDRFAVGVAATASYLSLQDTNYDDAWTFPFTMTLGWYW